MFLAYMARPDQFYTCVELVVDDETSLNWYMSLWRLESKSLFIGGRCDQLYT